MAERTGYHVQQIGEEDLLDIHRDRAGFDLGQVEDVANQIEQVRPRAVNSTGELDLPGRQIAVGIVAELLA